MTMAYFRKKPVVIEARKLTMETALEVSAWCGSTQSFTKGPFRAVSGIMVPTLESPHEASWGDWIIRGVQGEFYPCKPDIFVATYELAE